MIPRSEIRARLDDYREKYQGIVKQKNWSAAALLRAKIHALEWVMEDVGYYDRED